MAWQPPPPPPWAMPLAEKLGEALRVIAQHRGFIECDMVHDDVKRALFTVLRGLAVGDVYLSSDDEQEIIKMITGRKRVTIKESLKAIGKESGHDRRR